MTGHAYVLSDAFLRKPQSVLNTDDIGTTAKAIGGTYTPMANNHVCDGIIALPVSGFTDIFQDKAVYTHGDFQHVTHKEALTLGPTVLVHVHQVLVQKSSPSEMRF